MGFHQEALLDYEPTKELAIICSLTPEEVLDIVLPGWRDIKDFTYAESITWNQAIKIAEELDKCKEAAK